MRILTRWSSSVVMVTLLLGCSGEGANSTTTSATSSSPTTTIVESTTTIDPAVVCEDAYRSFLKYMGVGWMIRKDFWSDATLQMNIQRQLTGQPFPTSATEFREQAAEWRSDAGELHRLAAIAPGLSSDAFASLANAYDLHADAGLLIAAAIGTSDDELIKEGRRKVLDANIIRDGVHWLCDPESDEQYQ